jgi:HEPN domain-containing protein
VSAERVIANLLRIAREDLEGARMLNARGNRNAIYLCEQAAEKIIRAVLTSEKIHAGVRHQLDEMVNLLPDANGNWRALERETMVELVLARESIREQRS